jgi:hypothetical protein
MERKNVLEVLKKIQRAGIFTFKTGIHEEEFYIFQRGERIIQIYLGNNVRRAEELKMSNQEEIVHFLSRKDQLVGEYHDYEAFEKLKEFAKWDQERIKELKNLDSTSCVKNPLYPFGLRLIFFYERWEKIIKAAEEQLKKEHPWGDVLLQSYLPERSNLALLVYNERDHRGNIQKTSKIQAIDFGTREFTISEIEKILEVFDKFRIEASDKEGRRPSREVIVKVILIDENSAIRKHFVRVPHIKLSTEILPKL